MCVLMYIHLQAWNNDGSILQQKYSHDEEKTCIFSLVHLESLWVNFFGSKDWNFATFKQFFDWLWLEKHQKMKKIGK